MPDLIVVPTFNESGNILALLERLRSVVPDAHVLVVDDNSPDGTGVLVQSCQERDAAIHLLERTAKDGLGRAYVTGFAWGLARGYDRIVQMDADFSHAPEDVVRLLAASDNADLVLGSRYVPGGGTRNWGAGRRFLSKGGSWYARTLLGLPIRDLTGGFKCWRREALVAIELEGVRSNGYSFQIEMTWRAVRRDLRVAEVPIVFTDRVDGVSKMSKRIVLEAMTMVWRLRMSTWPRSTELTAGSAEPPTRTNRG
ncbi:MAG: polyprenol monophosphomannose synthase [Armatimonadota bacterium]